MAEISKATGYTPVNYVNTTAVPGVSLATVQPGAEHTVTGNLAGETIAGGDLCYVKSSDNRIYRSTGAAANAAAVVDGMAAENVTAGHPVTLYRGVVFNYGSALTPGTSYFLSGTVAGGIADAASTGGTTVVARSIDTTRLYVKTSY